MKTIQGVAAGWLLVFSVLSCTQGPALSQPGGAEAKLLGRWTNGDDFDLDFRRSGQYIVGCLVKVPSGWTGRQKVGANLFSSGITSGQQIKGLWANYPGKECAKLLPMNVPATISFKDNKTLILSTQKAFVGSQTHMITGEVRNCRWLAEREPVTYNWFRIGASQVGDDALVTIDDFKDHVLSGKGGKRSVFDRMDKDGNGCLSQQEITAALSNPEFKGKDAEAITVIYNNPAISTISEPTDGDKCNGISKDDISLITRNENNKNAVFDNLDTIRKLKDKSKGNLFGPGDAINSSAVKQGGAGDCNFLSPLSSFADTEEGKRAIREMIKPAGKDKDGNDQYTVTFHDPKNPGKTFNVTVSKPSESELINFAKGTENGTWPAVIEKAYGKWRQTHDEVGNVVSNNNPNEPAQISAGNHMTASNAITLLTGKKAENVSINSYFQNMNDLDKQMTNAFSGKKPIMTAAIEGPGEGDRKKPAFVKWLLQPAGGLNGGETKGAGLYAGHEYSVLGYNPATKEVTMRNPYGYNNAKSPNMNSKDGTFKMSLQDFQQNFSHFTVAK